MATFYPSDVKKICTVTKRIINKTVKTKDLVYHTRLFRVRQGKEMRQHGSCRIFSLLVEGFTVGALVNSGVQLMGANQDPVQRTVVFALTVMCTLLNGALDALICLVCHE